MLIVCKTNPSNIKSWEAFILVVKKAGVVYKPETETVDFIGDTLISEVDNIAIREILIAFLRQISFTKEIDTKKLYNRSLDLVAKNSKNLDTKTLALELGRLHYSINRENKVPTIYDEQAIQNDISVRSQ